MQNSIIKIIVSVIISLGLSSISAAISVYQYFTLHHFMQQRQTVQVQEGRKEEKHPIPEIFTVAPTIPRRSYMESVTIWHIAT